MTSSDRSGDRARRFIGGWSTTSILSRIRLGTQLAHEWATSGELFFAIFFPFDRNGGTQRPPPGRPGRPPRATGCAESVAAGPGGTRRRAITFLTISGVSWARPEALAPSSTKFRNRQPSACGVRFLKSPCLQGLILCLIAVASQSGLRRIFCKGRICFRQLTEYEARSLWRGDFSHQGTCLAQALDVVFVSSVHGRIPR